MRLYYTAYIKQLRFKKNKKIKQSPKTFKNRQPVS